MTLVYEDLPIDELKVLDELSMEYPGLRFSLFKQRAKYYMLTILPTQHWEEEQVKGEP